MEISEEIISSAFAHLFDAEPDPRLNQLLNGLTDYTIEELLFNRENNSTLNQQLQQIRTITTNKSNLNVIEFAGILLNAKMHFDQFFSKGDIKELIIFLHVNCYLKVNLLHFLNNKPLKKKIKKARSSDIAALLRIVRIKVEIPTTASYYEKELKTQADEGLKDNNAKKVYDFVLSVERGGRGFHFNFLLENLLVFFFQLDKEALVDQLNTLTLIEECVFYLQSFPKNALVDIANHVELTNKWALFELLRQLIDKVKKNEGVSVKDKNAVARCLNNLYEADSEIYFQSIPFFNNHNLFNAAIGKQLCRLTQTEINSVFKNWLPIDRYTNALEARTILLNEFKRHLSIDIYFMILQTVFDKWTTLKDYISNTDSEYINSLLLTSYANFVIQYYSEGRDTQQLLDLMVNLLEKMVWIDSEWFLNESCQIKQYYIYLSHFYLLSYAYKNKRLTNEPIRQLTAELRSNEALSPYILSNDYSKNIIEIFDNIHWERRHKPSRGTTLPKSNTICT